MRRCEDLFGSLNLRSEDFLLGGVGGRFEVVIFWG